VATDPSGHLVLTTRLIDGRSVVRVEGEIGAYSAPFIRDHFGDLLRFGTPDLVVDLEDAGFIDATGVNALYAVLRRTRTFDGSLQIVCSRQRLLELFLVTALPAEFLVYDTLAQAMASA
jgi:anti-sigma B factor antagonist